MRLWLLTLAPAAVSVLLACSSGSSPSPGAAGAPPTGGPGGDDAGMSTGDDASSTATGYPAGPYSSGVGGILPDVHAQGYRLSPQETDSAKLPWDMNIDVAEYHRRAQCKCLVISVAATWCGACMQEQPALIAAVQGDPGFCALGILQDGLSGGSQQPATQADVFDWTQRFHQNFYVVQGNQGTEWGLILGHGSGSSVPLPFSLIVKPSTMTVVGEIDGARSDVHDYAMGLCAN
jgi:hypothetical protein